MRIQFEVFGEAVPERRRSFYVGKPGDRRMVNVRKSEVTHWINDLKAQAATHKPPTLPLSEVHLLVEFVLDRPGYLMQPKYYWRCRSRKCGWQGTDGAIEIVPVYGMPGSVLDEHCCPTCKGPVHEPAKTPPHIVKPDAENLLKTTADALTGLFWKDDSQLSPITISKRWCRLEEQPHVAFVVEALD